MFRGLLLRLLFPCGSSNLGLGIHQCFKRTVLAKVGNAMHHSMRTHFQELSCGIAKCDEHVFGFRCLVASVIYSFESSSALLACDPQWHICLALSKLCAAHVIYSYGRPLFTSAISLEDKCLLAHWIRWNPTMSPQPGRGFSTNVIIALCSTSQPPNELNNFRVFHWKDCFDFSIFYVPINFMSEKMVPADWYTLLSCVAQPSCPHVPCFDCL